MTTRRTAHRGVGALLGALCLMLGAAQGAAAHADTPAAAPAAPTFVVFAAASLTEALDELDGAFTAQTHIRVKASYAASSVLAKQIEAGAPADVFFSADHEWMDYLEQRKLLRTGTRRDVLGNELVLIAPADSAVRLKIAPGFALAQSLGDGRLASADPDSVPAGLYGRAALTKLGVWDSVQSRLARAENVRAALAYVARGETPLGIVYRTDAQAEKRVRVVDVFPEDTHPPILHPAALTANAQPQAQKYLEFLFGPAAQEIFRRYGFRIVNAPR
jgi:molybdate transport system substrate-binding protein